ncbi:MAG: fatty acid CoA ligase family protein [Elusimicrobiota bacterium]
MNIAERLAGVAARIPENKAVVQGERSWTFRQLEDEVSLLAAGLRRAGLEPGARAALMVPPGFEFIALTFALFRAGIVPVLIDPGMGRHHLGQCLAEAAPEAFIGIPKAQLARAVERWAKDTIKLLVTVGSKWPWGGLSLLELRVMGALKDQASGSAARNRDCSEGTDTAAILFTSGSTGVPKGAVYTHEILTAQTELLRSHFDIKEGETSVPTFPLFALFDVALGMTVVIPDMDSTRPGSVEPMSIIGPVQKHGAAQLFGSPALLDRVGRFGEKHGISLPGLKRVISAGAPVPASVLARFAKMLPAGVRLHTPYGATESLPVSAISSDELLRETAPQSAQGKGTCVGRPFPGMRARIIAIDDGPVPRWSDDLLVPPGQVGEIVVQGPVVTREYFRRPEATALAKIEDEGGAFWHRMGDLGFFDEQGRLWFCGRKSHRVQAAEGTMFTIPCEAVFNEHPKVRRTALVGIGQPGAQTPVLCVELERGELPGEAIKDELLEVAASYKHTMAIKSVLFHPSFPVDIRHNAKIFREKLAVWAETQL